MDLLKANLREFIKNNDGLQGTKELLDSDLSLSIEKILMEVTNTVRNRSKIGQIEITPEVENHVTKCAFIWLLNELLHNEALSKTEALGYLMEFNYLLESLQSSSYGFDDDTVEEFELDNGDYDDFWADA